MRVTKLEYQKKDPNRVNVYVDEEFMAGIDIDDVVRLGLYKGQEISLREVNKIIAESEFGKLFNAALNFLSFRPRSEWEVKSFLHRKVTKIKKNKIREQDGRIKERKIEDETEKMGKLVDQVIEKLRKINQINDEEFARWYLEQRQTFRPMGERGLKYELRKKGIAKTIIDQLTSKTEREEGEPRLSEHQLAQRALAKTSARLRPADYSPDKIHQTQAKLQRFLAGRGFDWDVIKSVVDEIVKKGYNN